MDNQAPGLKFFGGQLLLDLTELDVDSMEFLPGASSALYGPGGMNGTLLINSKNPFKYQGLSFQAKDRHHAYRRKRKVCSALLQLVAALGHKKYQNVLHSRSELN